MTISAILVDIHNRIVYPAQVSVLNGRIDRIIPVDAVPDDSGYILPGFIDAHVHVESSMLPPTEFARMAVVHGTVGSVSDPHEIANVLGSEGVHYMLEEARNSPFKFCFGAPSCVPATGFETAGAFLDSKEVESLLHNPEIGYLSEMMNFPGVLFNDAEVIAKINAAQRVDKPIDGHAPGLRGEEAKTYFSKGISTDHECFTYEEGLDKARLGVKILIREGSAARNFEALWPLVNEFPQQIMFCSDDKHPDDLVQGHINKLVTRALTKGCDLFDVLRAACLHPVEHYRLPIGLLREGERADFIRVDNLTAFNALETWIDGVCVARGGKCLLPKHDSVIVNRFETEPKQPQDFVIPAHNAASQVRVIRALDGQIVTQSEVDTIQAIDGCWSTNLSKDILKIAVVNRYERNARPMVAFVSGFGLKNGALASSVAHDSHNIVAVGVDDASLAKAVNAVINAKGGISACNSSGQTQILPLPIAGLMSAEEGTTLAHVYAGIDSWVKKELGCTLEAPFMALSFLALPVIPSLKITDLGLFDVNLFQFVPIEIS